MTHETFWKSRATVDPTSGGVITLAATVALASDKDKLKAGFRAGVYETEMHWGACARVSGLMLRHARSPQPITADSIEERGLL